MIGPYGLDWIDSLPIANAISEWGVMLLLFSLGLETSLSKLRKMLRPLFSLGMTQVITTSFVGFCFFSLAFDFSQYKSILFGCLLALSSTAAILKLLQDAREMETPFGRVNVTILLSQDLAALLIILLIAGSSQSSFVSGLSVALSMIVAVVGIIVLGRFAIPTIFDQVVKTGSRELFFFLVMSVTLGTALMAEYSGLSLSIGAFLAGVVISESPYSKQALAELSLMRDNFLGLLFASFGMLLDLNFVSAHIVLIALMAVGLFLMKAASVYGVVRLNRYPHGVAFSSAISLSQIGEFSFILAAVALKAGIVDLDEFQYFLSLAVLSLLASPILFSWARRVSAHSDWRAIVQSSTNSPAPVEKRVVTDNRGPAIVIGLGHAGYNVMESLKGLGIDFCGIDFNSGTIKRLRSQGFSVIFGDASREEILHAAGIHSAYLVIVTVTGKHLTSRILSAIRKIRADISVIVRTQYILDLDEIAVHQNDRMVVAEFETAREILAKVLVTYEVEPAQIHRVLEKCDLKMRELLSGVQSESHALQGPYWKALASVRLFPVVTVHRESLRLADLAIRQKTGCNIAAIYRSGVGLTFPDGKSEVRPGDILYAMGSRESLDELSQLVERGFS